MSKQGNKSTVNIILLILVILEGLVIAYLLYQNNLNKKHAKVLEVQLTRNTYEKDSLMSELEDIYQSYAELQTDNDSLNKQLMAQKKKVKQLMMELRRVKSVDKAKIEQLKKQVATLRKILKSYIREVDSLYESNKILQNENRQIKEQYQQVIEEKQEIQEVAESLQTTVKIAKKLTITNIRFNALNKRGRNISKIKRTNKFEVCLTVLPNNVAAKSYRNLYIRITKPDGEVILNSKSGLFTYEGKEIYYSAKRKFYYTGEETDLCVYFDNKDLDLPPGKYTVFIFINSYQVGDASITLK